MLGGAAAPLLAQTAQTPAPAPAAPPQPAPAIAAPPAPITRTIRSIAVRGNQRLEPETIRAYANLSPGQTYTAATLDQALKDLYATQLFADVTISGAAVPPSMVPTRSKAPARRLKLFDLEITLPRLVCNWCRGALRR